MACSITTNYNVARHRPYDRKAPEIDHVSQCSERLDNPSNANVMLKKGAYTH